MGVVFSSRIGSNNFLHQCRSDLSSISYHMTLTCSGSKSFYLIFIFTVIKNRKKNLYTGSSYHEICFFCIFCKIKIVWHPPDFSKSSILIKKNLRILNWNFSHIFLLRYCEEILKKDDFYAIITRNRSLKGQRYDWMPKSGL